MGVERRRTEGRMDPHAGGGRGVRPARGTDAAVTPRAPESPPPPPPVTGPVPRAPRSAGRAGPGRSSLSLRPREAPSSSVHRALRASTASGPQRADASAWARGGPRPGQGRSRVGITWRARPGPESDRAWFKLRPPRWGRRGALGRGARARQARQARRGRGLGARASEGRGEGAGAGSPEVPRSSSGAIDGGGRRRRTMRGVADS